MLWYLFGSPLGPLPAVLLFTNMVGLIDWLRRREETKYGHDSREHG